MDWIGRWKLSDVGYLAFFGKTKSNRSVECVRKSKRVAIAIRAGYTHRNDEDARRLVLDSDMSDVVDEVETMQKRNQIIFTPYTERKSWYHIFRHSTTG